MNPEFNERNRMDGRDLLAWVADSAAALVVLDPQHRAVLDKMEYGNAHVRNPTRHALPQMSDALIRRFVEEAERVLRPSGHLLLWIDKFLLAGGRWQRWMPDPTPMREVDCFIWDKDRMGMGKRGRCYYEAMMVIQKAPIRAKGFWHDRRLRDVFTERQDRRRHPHAKPPEFTKRMILNTTRRGDLVVDPCAGGYGVLDACLATKRTFLGADLVK